MNKLLIYLLKLKIKKSTHKMNKIDNTIVKQAYQRMIYNYNITVLYLSVTKNKL